MMRLENLSLASGSYVSPERPVRLFALNLSLEQSFTIVRLRYILDVDMYPCFQVD